MFLTEIMDMRFEKDETKKATLKEQLISESIPYFCKKWDVRAGENGGYIAIKKVSSIILLQKTTAVSMSFSSSQYFFYFY